MLGVRLDAETEARLTSVARAQRRSKSEVSRDAIRLYVERNDTAYRAECRRQSLAVAAAPRNEHDLFWDALATETWDEETSNL